ncbi:Protein-tyrosine phosphatase,receptor/non-receptor type domain and Protein-tyrosine/Dual specificity phosphatase domain and Protein-tyrosine phosphatase, catalytic domain-containing protein [Strongyloides ratti]|uniref:Protein-tyrosine phosphatase,receptor/non-receptor type domain and Protein-tyrosine/Dual specificity phosphatase domain and Protein-tyrosine phosphatase, catalytic domain-containing protein n=1 Tax=Strongyloides ratti TaxID=34506 RepID=A0A090KX98_STRRB|nr:Protein-tyrosine phosphatase,receptor/non-receptor type domain and Protein-tyrosine/Dual specificity phosphatase domain and Protein-tyrosine phosphatase, catalytic domain-containing protein [Strongyloides ratti]CEF59872.1 Protein-tyrosine phosphatase,receptor/non-receptor type domain and Protein-tyrosine/Dual specificity phosphatase domain and Protein-tyrosine phosphatase, catalytic domain-containing protein [Strongyloides ratti]
MNCYNKIIIQFSILLLFKSQLCLNQHKYYFSQLADYYDSLEKFPLQYQIEGSFPSDIILLKCPGPTYNHNNKEDTFKVNGTYDKDIVKGLPDESVIRWIKVFNSEKKLEKKITCGELILNKNPLELIKWEINLKWNSPPNPLKSINNYFVNSSLGASTIYCFSDRGLQFVKKKNGTVIQYENEKTAIYHKGDLIYLFEKLDKTLDKSEPCQIFRAIQFPPIIVIKNASFKIINLEHMNITKIEKYAKRETIDLKLFINKENITQQQFYEYENVLITDLKFYLNGSIKEHGKFEISNTTINIEDYKLFRVKYVCDECHNQGGINNIIIKDFYISPTEKDYIETFPDVYISKNHSLITPNCSLDQYTFGFLYKMAFEKLEITVNDFLIKNKNESNTFLLSNSTIFFKNETYNGTLQCIYSTPDNGTFTTKTVFITIRANKNSTSQQIVLKKSKSEFYLAIIIPTSVLLLILIFFVFFFLVRKRLKKFKKGKIIKKKLLNVENFWKRTPILKMSDYSQMLSNDDSAKCKERKVLGYTIGGEFVKVYYDDVYNDTLVNSQKKLVNKISAHYITSVSPSRTYILSEGPSSDNVSQFWEMIFEEKVRVIVAFVYNVVISASEPFEIYWPTKKSTKYGKLTVINEGETDSFIKNVTTINFKIIKEGGDKIIVTLFYANYWKENTIPDKINNLPDLYEEVNKIAGKKPVLVHSSSINGPRTFLFVFFAGIVESYINDQTFFEPIDVIRKIRQQKHGGYISAMEYVFLIFSVVEYMVKNQYLLNDYNYNRYSNFYYGYLSGIKERIKNIDGKYSNVLKFFIHLDENKLYWLVDMADKVGKLTNNELKIKCKRSILLTEYEKKIHVLSGKLNGLRNRFSGLHCLDKHAIDYTISTDVKHPFDKMSMANVITFTNSENEKKRFIMMPSPLEEMYDAFIGFIYTYNVSVVLALDNAKEIMPEKWKGYWPYCVDKIEYKNFTISVASSWTQIENGFNVSYYDIVHTTDINYPKKCFKMVHFCEWPSKNSIPNKDIVFAGMRRYAVKECSKERPMIIHCKNGIGRTGTVAYSLYMMETLCGKNEFDPLHDLLILRKCRLDAVQTRQQFLMSLLALLHFIYPSLLEYDYNTFLQLKAYFLNAIDYENMIDDTFDH